MSQSFERRGRRALCAFTLAALLGLASSPAYAGTYLNRAVLLLTGATREAAYLRARFSDKELARVTQRLAEARLEAARAMSVPKDVVLAHPHLLLVLENYVQSAEAATRGDGERFIVHQQRALDEERTFRAVLKHHGWSLPESDQR